MDGEKVFEEIKVLSPKAGDVLLLKLPFAYGKIPSECYDVADGIALFLRHNFPGVKLLAVTKDHTLELLTDDRLAELGLQRIGQSYRDRKPLL